jgi:hypothetical protein
VDVRPLTRFLVVGAALVAVATSCTQKADPIAVSSNATTTAPGPTSSGVETTTLPPETTAAPETTLPATTIESTTTSTTEPPPEGWVAVDSMPDLAYPPCCESDYYGTPSPQLPANPTDGLLPGIYHARRLPGDTSTTDISFDVARFVPCSELDADACFASGDPGSMGVSPQSRTFTLPLNDGIRVVVSGYECDPVQQAATADYLRPLMSAFDRDYDQLLGGPFADGEDPDSLMTALRETPAGGFAAPNCPVSTEGLVWKGAEGPPILMQVAFAYDEDGPKLPASASAEWLRLTAIGIDQNGFPTLYFFAGFYS